MSVPSMRGICGSQVLEVGVFSTRSFRRGISCVWVVGVEVVEDACGVVVLVLEETEGRGE